MTGKFKKDQIVTITMETHGHQFQIGENVRIDKVCKHGYLCTNLQKETWMVTENEILEMTF